MSDYDCTKREALRPKAMSVDRMCTTIRCCKIKSFISIIFYTHRDAAMQTA